jgi:hypothetical protein
VTRRPTRATTSGRAYLDLQNLARRVRRPTDELHQMYALEGFLDRLAGSLYADNLVLKGGVLLAAYDARRPTRDVDLQGRWMSNDVNRIQQMVREIAAHDLSDGLVFDVDRATAETIRDGDIYSGVRVNLTGQLSAARLNLHVDVNVGDPIWPAPTTVSIPRLLDGRIELTGYPLAMVHAEKLVTACWRGVANTRWRDFADIHLLARRHDIDGSQLATALQKVAAHRGVASVPLQIVLTGYANLAQQRWAAWLRKSGLDSRLPVEFAAVLDQVVSFADPAITGTANGRTWVAIDAAWSGQAR